MSTLQATSCRQHLIQLVENRLELVSEELVRLPQSALLREGHVLEVIRDDGDVGGDVVADGFQPLPLLVAELPTLALLLR